MLHRVEDNLCVCSAVLQSVDHLKSYILTNVCLSSVPPLCQRPTWFPQWWRRPLVSSLSRANCTCSPPRPTRTLCSSALWSTACQETRSNRRSQTPSPSTSTVSGEAGLEHNGWRDYTQLIYEKGLQPGILQFSLGSVEELQGEFCGKLVHFN